MVDCFAYDGCVKYFRKYALHPGKFFQYHFGYIFSSVFLTVIHYTYSLIYENLSTFFLLYSDHPRFISMQIAKTKKREP